MQSWAGVKMFRSPLLMISSINALVFWASASLTNRDWPVCVDSRKYSIPSVVSESGILTTLALIDIKISDDFPPNTTRADPHAAGIAPCVIDRSLNWPFALPSARKLTLNPSQIVSFSNSLSSIINNYRILPLCCNRNIPRNSLSY